MAHFHTAYHRQYQFWGHLQNTVQIPAVQHFLYNTHTKYSFYMKHCVNFGEAIPDGGKKPYQ
jgi:hypothetical protein